MSIAAGIEHRYGPYGGQYVPETLMPALEELEAAWIEARLDPGYAAELERPAGATTPGGRRRSISPSA